MATPHDASFLPWPPIQIGAIIIAPTLLLAPMAGITDLPFRTICRRFGVGLTVTEMIASRAVAQKRPRSERMAVVGADESPVAVQIAGSDSGYLADAARWAVAHGAALATPRSRSLRVSRSLRTSTLSYLCACSGPRLSAASSSS